MIIFLILKLSGSEAELASATGRALSQPHCGGCRVRGRRERRVLGHRRGLRELLLLRIRGHICEGMDPTVPTYSFFHYSDPSFFLRPPQNRTSFLCVKQKLNPLETPTRAALNKTVCFGHFLFADAAYFCCLVAFHFRLVGSICSIETSRSFHFLLN